MGGLGRSCLYSSSSPVPPRLVAAAILFRVRIHVILADESPDGRQRVGNESLPLFTVEVPNSFGAEHQATDDIWIALVSDLHYLSTDAMTMQKGEEHAAADEINSFAKAELGVTGQLGIVT